MYGISIHALLAESDFYLTFHQTRCIISIHALLAESDDCKAVRWRFGCRISIHALLAESDHIAKFLNWIRHISIHALLAESDRLGLLGWLRVLISIHALLAESDNKRFKAQVGKLLFLSTLSLRRATKDTLLALLGGYYFYPRSPCGERQDTPLISIPKPDFYPRSPCGERQLNRPPPLTSWAISIHALLAESDGGGLLSYFGKITFLSTLSLRRATSDIGQHT